MKVFTQVAAMQDMIDELKVKGSSIGFVPTMGALHEGHISIVQRSQAVCDVTIVSIYINPLQFNNNSDFNNYPIKTDEDMKMLEAMGCDILFLPLQEEIEPSEKEKEFDLEGLSEIMEGHFRPGHLQGMIAIVNKFFDVIQPDKAFFGEKDYQQLASVKKLVQKKQLKVEVVPCATKRESSGLAMSSRNSLLTASEKEEAVKIYDTLVFARRNSDRLSPLELKMKCLDLLSDSSIKPEYIEIVDESAFMNIDEWDESDRPRVFVAAYLGTVRLIDNMSLID